ncbi:dTMP kinase [Angomonas deanei]|nr:dTMP kinase [Angomonas deanei]|eukprot:EPY42611.1 dTMP kinase [Angomonas deanei]
MASCETISPLQMTGSDESTIEQFLYKADTPGKVFVIEGGDGAGKATQTGMLVDKLKKENYSVHTLDFPYEKGLFGALIRIVLSGKKGGIGDLDPALFSFLYSLNRYGCLPELSLWMRRGSVTVLDRFYTANFGHQASKLPEDQRKDFINRLEHLEVDWLGLPQADLVFYLDLPPKAALEAMKQDHTRKYLDIHETAGNNYKENVRLTYVWCCENLKGWNHILCCNSDGERFERSHISSLIHERVARTI